MGFVSLVCENIGEQCPHFRFVVYDHNRVDVGFVLHGAEEYFFFAMKRSKNKLCHIIF